MTLFNLHLQDLYIKEGNNTLLLELMLIRLHQVEDSVEDSHLEAASAVAVVAVTAFRKGILIPFFIC
jgi:hypothetical protein